MQTKIVFAGLAALASIAAAQNGISFTSVPTTVDRGQPATVTYEGGDPNSPATVILRKGDPGNLETVSTLTTSATGGSFTWTPDQNLEGDDYALEIRQGDSINYSGPIGISGTAATAASSAASASATSASASVSSAISSSVSEISSSVSEAVSSILSSASVALNSTIPTLTPVGSVGPSGTGIPMSRNTTMVSPTLSSTATETETSSETETATETSSETATDGANASQTGAPSTNSAAGLSSPLALVLGAVAAMIYLN